MSFAVVAIVSVYALSPFWSTKPQPGAVSVTLLELVVAFALTTKAVELVTELTVALLGMPEPTIGMPESVAVSDSDEPVPVAEELMTNFVEFVTVVIVALLPISVPVMDIPGAKPDVLLQVTVVLPLVVEQPVRLTVVAPINPAVLAQVTVALPFVVAHPVSVTPSAERVRDDPLPVALALMTNVVVFVIELTVVPVGMFVPATSMPGQSEAVLAQATVELPLVVEHPARMIGVV
jgi:hypothetical protein